jgi:hypothetical protein
MMPQFGIDGPVLDDTIWYNAKTGDSFKVRSNYFEDNNMVVQTYDGRRFNLNQLTDYLQWVGKDLPPKNPTPQPSKAVKEELPPEIAAEIGEAPEEGLIDPEDLAMISGAKPAAPKESRQLNLPVSKTQASNRAFIEKALCKAKFPNWSIVMKWPNFPQNEISLLFCSMDIPIDEIADYYLDNITQEFDSFMGNIKKQLRNYLIEKIIPKEEPEVKTKAVKTTTKKK